MVYEKLAILDADLVDQYLITIWTVCYSLLRVSRRPRSRRRSKLYPLINGTATHQYDQWTMYDASHRSYVEDKLSKTISDSIFRDL